MEWSELFIDVTKLPPGLAGFVQLSFLLMCYFFIFFSASQMLDEGGELLLLTPLAGLVGSVILPIVGARHYVKQRKVDIDDDGQCKYSRPKCSGKRSFLFGQGTETMADVPTGAKAMVLTGLTYLAIQIPVSFMIWNQDAAVLDAVANANWNEEAGSGSETIDFEDVQLLSNSNRKLLDQKLLAKLLAKPDIDERPYAFAALCICLVTMVGYVIYTSSLWWRGQDYAHQLHVDTVIINKIKKKQVSLLAALQAILVTLKDHGKEPTEGDGTPLLFGEGSKTDLLAKRLRPILHPFFHSYDADNSGHIDLYDADNSGHINLYNADNSGQIDLAELTRVMMDLGMRTNAGQVAAFFQQYDSSGDGRIEFDEFVSGTASMLFDPTLQEELMTGRELNEDGELGMHVFVLGEEEIPEDFDKLMTGRGLNEDGEVDLHDIVQEDLGEEEIPEDFVDLPPKLQQHYIVLRSLLLMTLGTAMCLIFSDPMVTAMTEISTRVGIPPFYVAFVLSPIVTGAFNIVDAYGDASPKTRRSITFALTGLQGTTCMNNTFTLGGLRWEYTAETIMVLSAITVVGLLTMRRVQRMWVAVTILLVYPASLLFVTVMERHGIQ
eukprot:gene18928-25495_t